MRPLAIDLYCGLGGWTEGLLAEGFDVVGFDIEQHAYGDHRYPAQLVLQDVRTLHGRQFKDAALIVGSSPCQEFSWRAMPNAGGSWFGVAHNTGSGLGQNPDGRKVPGIKLSEVGFNVAAVRRLKDAGLKEGGRWFTRYGPGHSNPIRRTGSKSTARKAASAAIAKIPFPLARHIAAVYAVR